MKNQFDGMKNKKVNKKVNTRLWKKEVIISILVTHILGK